MTTIVFSFKEGIDAKRRAAIVRRISNWEMVEHAMPLKPRSASPDVRRMYFARVPDSESAIAASKRLRRIVEIESASIPPSRAAA